MVSFKIKVTFWCNDDEIIEYEPEAIEGVDKDIVCGMALSGWENVYKKGRSLILENLK